MLDDRGVRAYDIEAIPGLCYWRDKEGERVPFPEEVTQEFQDTHEWHCDTSQLMQENEDSSLVLSGPPLKQDSFYEQFDMVVLLQCSKETFMYRLENRDNNEYGKNTELRKNILNWYEKFENRMLSLGAVSVNTDADIQDVVEEIAKLIRE